MCESLATGQYDDDRVRLETPCNEAQNLERGYVKPVCVVDDDRDGLTGCKVAQQVQCRQRDEEYLRAGPRRAEGIQKDLPLPVRRAIRRGHYRSQALLHAGEWARGLRFHT